MNLNESGNTDPGHSPMRRYTGTSASTQGETNRKW